MNPFMVMIINDILNHELRRCDYQGRIELSIVIFIIACTRSTGVAIHFGMKLKIVFQGQLGSF